MHKVSSSTIATIEHFLYYGHFSKEIIIPITAAILGIAVPLLIGVIQRIDDKYESTRLIQLFMNERSTKHFLGLLAITIFLLFYQWSLHLTILISEFLQST